MGLNTFCFNLEYKVGRSILYYPIGQPVFFDYTKIKRLFDITKHFTNKNKFIFFIKKLARMKNFAYLCIKQMGKKFPRLCKQKKR